MELLPYVDPDLGGSPTRPRQNTPAAASQAPTQHRSPMSALTSLAGTPIGGSPAPPSPSAPAPAPTGRMTRARAPTVDPAPPARRSASPAVAPRRSTRSRSVAAIPS